jgi:hypothetical protein
MANEVRPDKEGFLKLTEAGVKDNFAQDLALVEKSSRVRKSRRT